MERYCCNKKCFTRPQYEVDGMACRKCESFCYCKCKCDSYNHNPPTLVMLKLYKTKHLFTCCMDVCTKFYIHDITSQCSKCFPKTFCECKLQLCKNRKDWES